MSNDSRYTPIEGCTSVLVVPPIGTGQTHLFPEDERTPHEFGSEKIPDRVRSATNEIIRTLYPSDATHFKIFIRIYNQLRDSPEYSHVDNIDMMAAFFFDYEEMHSSGVDIALLYEYLHSDPSSSHRKRLIRRVYGSLSKIACGRSPLESHMIEWDKTLVCPRLSSDQRDFDLSLSRGELRRSTVNQLSLLVKNSYREEGFEWNGYYAFVNPTHPFCMVANGNLRLVPPVFEHGVDPRTLYTGELIDQEIRSLDTTSLRQLAHLKHITEKRVLPTRLGRGSTWSRRQLKDAIINAGLVAAGRPESERVVSSGAERSSSQKSSHSRQGDWDEVSQSRPSSRVGHHLLPV